MHNSGAQLNEGHGGDHVARGSNVAAQIEETTEPGEGAYVTETVGSGIAGMEARASEIDAKITDLISVACQILDHVKEQFIERMERLREEVSAFQKNQTEQWMAMSMETHECIERLQNAQHLVQRLTLGASDPLRDEE
ncbi:hypothetical protein BSKO_05323 [Bryopsis sp. KO-2023]|nr:hypothetical protein BSKO_05323 [Bryopsis sp. KO-2023]